ncbi:MAG: phage head closure protein [Planctomycetes bacterium]|nr:phage head closure protein [Planctomycetota bacterium]
MRAGQLRHEIIIQSAATAPNSYGEGIETWSTFATVRASIIPISGKEYFSANQEQSSVSHKVSMRYLSGVNTKMRVLFGDRVYNVKSVINFQERDRELQLMVTEDV